MLRALDPQDLTEPTVVDREQAPRAGRFRRALERRRAAGLLGLLLLAVTGAELLFGHPLRLVAWHALDVVSGFGLGRWVREAVSRGRRGQ